MARSNQMRKKTKINISLLMMLLLPIQCFANDIKQYLPSLNNYMFADAEACRSCIDAAGCERVLRECQAECNATSFFKESEIESCGVSCSVAWSACVSKARAACTYDCKEES
jgi:hypothetical protein